MGYEWEYSGQNLIIPAASNHGHLVLDLFMLRPWLGGMYIQQKVSYPLRTYIFGVV